MVHVFQKSPQAFACGEQVSLKNLCDCWLKNANFLKAQEFCLVRACDHEKTILTPTINSLFKRILQLQILSLYSCSPHLTIVGLSKVVQLTIRGSWWQDVFVVRAKRSMRPLGNALFPRSEDAC